MAGVFPSDDAVYGRPQLKYIFQQHCILLGCKRFDRPIQKILIDLPVIADDTIRLMPSAYPESTDSLAETI